MADFSAGWERIRRHQGEQFRTKTGLPFTYAVLGNFLRIQRGEHEINRSLSRTNFEKAAVRMPVEGPGRLRDRQGSSYTWAILTDDRIRHGQW